MCQCFQLHDTYLFSDAGETTSLAALVDWIDDPVNPGITANLNFKSVKIQKKEEKKQGELTALWLGSTRITS